MKQIHQEFEKGFIWWAIGIAVFGGFMLGGHIAMQIGFDMGLPQALDVWIQVHGHLQLVGWAGLFIMGVSLHFLPRMASVPVQKRNTLKLILYLTVLGLLLRANFEFWKAYVDDENFVKVFEYASRFGNIVEFVGIIFYIFVLLKTFLKASDFKKRGFEIVKPFFILFLLGWLIYSLVQASAVLFERYEWIVWNKWSIWVFMNFTLFPISFAFSILNFPLYIHLKPPAKSIKYLGYAYLISVLTHAFALLPTCEITMPFDFNFTALIVDLLIIALLFNSGIIQRIFLPDLELSKSPFWRRDRIEEKGSNLERKPRRGYSDYGEFGRFELLIYSAYVWLLIGLFLDILARVFMLAGLNIHYGEDPVRHSFFAGFITLLILGMAQRMLPGFMHKSKIANTKIVFWTFILGNVSVFSRVVPMLVPLYLSGSMWIFTKIMLYLFGVSGFIAIASIILLYVNLWKTLKMGENV
ncbi:hypothetical protein [Candidatus Chrysopegis kryptomonas]|uniref:Uncharacterized protein n=1 Tax=Candidatus Chryseopegocella kryptomonas TaxID=1633643 RepID=A0A0N7MWU1_9BACT|nr:hypothetical protein [Candidatus Chrysopegis kryptomonas]CUS99587.1 hypothetical protein JGI23_00688 [Candidatus Chrysopegis kryptomonas]